MARAAGEDAGLFHEVAFYIVTSDKLPEDTAQKIRQLLLDNGATEAELQVSEISKVPFNPVEVTHIIATDVDFPGYFEVQEALKCVVTPQWVETSVHKGRLAHVRPFTPDPRLFFSGVIATIAELPIGDKEAICGGIIAMGGQYTSSLTKVTTHIVALNLDNEKCNQAIARKLNVKIVLPHWFDDCLKLNRRIDESPYLLPNPEIERLDSSQPVPLPEGPNLKYAHSNGNMERPPVPRPDFKVFSGKRVMLGSDLEVSSRLRGVLSDIIKQARGETTGKVEAAHVYIGQWRDGEEYIQASRKGLDVGNLTWLYWMLAHGKWTNPLNRLLHYPLVKGGIPGMEKNIITVSNYGGDARLYLENLIEASGAKFTKSMKADNTHLVTARAHSEKCSAAREWNIHMVNHLWLEETYAKWQVQSMTDPKYTHFPTRTNLMEVVGQTPIDPRTIQQFYSPEVLDEDEDGDVEMAEHRNDKPERPVDGTLAALTPAVVGPSLSDKPRMAMRFSTPGNRSRLPNESLTWSTTSSSRKAKEQASQRLHDSIVPDMNLYEKEKKRKGGVLNPGRWRSRSRSQSQSRDVSRGSPSEGAELGTGDEDVSKTESTKPNKKAKKKVKPSIKLLITGYSPWSSGATEERDKRKLLDIGIQCVPDPQMCTHLAAPKIVRTEKFLCALARTPVIVNTNWVEACLDQDRLVDIDRKYLLDDPEGEKKLDMTLSASLSRAAKNKGELLKGIIIYTTPSVNGGFETCKKIVEANGGVCINFAKAKRGNTGGDPPASGKVVLLSSDIDSKYWKPFVNMAGAIGRGVAPLIFKTDWLLDLAMKQKIVWDGGRYAVPKTNN